jgi:glycosyl transferase family 25
MVVPTYLINLRRDGARLARMSAQLSRLGLDFERLEAIHGLDMPGWLQPYFFNADGKVASRLLPGEIGCYASHLVACATVAQRGVPALVLEDDLEISDGFTDLLRSFSSLPAGWDIVRLSNPHKRACIRVSGLTDRYSLVKFSRVPPSTGAYLLSPTGARKFLGWKLLRTLPVDQDLRRTWDCGLRTYGVFPQPVLADIGASTIDAMQMRSRQKLRKMFGVQDYLARSWHEICWIGPGAWMRSRVNFGSRYRSAAAGSAMLSERTSF